MTKASTRKAAQPAPATPDPLADLRDGTDERAMAPQEPEKAPQAPSQEEVGAEGPSLLSSPHMGLLEDEDGAPFGQDVQDAFLQRMTDALMDLAADPKAGDPAVIGWEQAVERWHADTVSLGFLHRGGRCGCRYIAQRILGA